MNRVLNLISNILVIGFALLAFLYHNQDFGLELIMFKEITIFFPIILLLIGGCIYGLVETYTYTIRLPLDKICYQKHSTDDLKLNCCLNAEYVWNEGFSFSDTPPKECKIFMDWNN